jgi:hypothetical protein
MVAGCIDNSSSEDGERAPVLNEKGASSVFHVTARLFTDAVTLRTSCNHVQAEEPYANVGGAADGQGVIAEQVARQDASH